MSFNDDFKQKVLEKLRESTEPKLYDTWLKSISFIEEPDGTLKIPLPSFFHVEHYKKNYQSLIEQTVSEVSGKNYTITFTVQSMQGRLFPDEVSSRAKTSLKEAQGLKKGQFSEETGRRDGLKMDKYDFTLNGQYVFDKFVVGLCNRLAHAAALAVVEKPGKAYNPIFIHGGVGLGKTHLLQAICHQIIEKHPDYSIYYRSGEGFVNDYITAIKNNSFEKFRQQCRSKDVLIIDDIHFLGEGKVASQEEFFHTFNALHNTQKQIILSSDSSPKEIPVLQDRLVSRFNWGMVARLEPPDFETRVAILRRKAEIYKIELPDDVVKFVAETVTANIRDLEGALIRLIGLARSCNQIPSVVLASEALKDFVGVQSSRIKIADIMDAISSYFNLSVAELQSKKRIKSVALARQVGIYLTRQLKTDMSLEEIGASFGGREHSTVLHSIEKIRKRSQKDSQFKETLNLLMSEIRRKSV